MLLLLLFFEFVFQFLFFYSYLVMSSGRTLSIPRILRVIGHQSLVYNHSLLK